MACGCSGCNDYTDCIYADNTEYVSCPFCKDDEFDLPGLKRHLTIGGCQAFEEVEDCTVVAKRNGDIAIDFDPRRLDNGIGGSALEFAREMLRIADEQIIKDGENFNVVVQNFKDSSKEYRQVFLATNPRNEGGWLAKKFELPTMREEMAAPEEIFSKGDTNPNDLVKRVVDEFAQQLPEQKPALDIRYVQTGDERYGAKEFQEDMKLLFGSKRDNTGGYLERSGKHSVDTENTGVTPDQIIKDQQQPYPYRYGINLVSPRQMRGLEKVAKVFNCSVDAAWNLIHVNNDAGKVYLEVLNEQE